MKVEWVKGFAEVSSHIFISLVNQSFTYTIFHLDKMNDLSYSIDNKHLYYI